MILYDTFTYVMHGDTLNVMYLAITENKLLLWQCGSKMCVIAVKGFVFAV